MLGVIFVGLIVGGESKTKRINLYIYIQCFKLDLTFIHPISR